MHKFPALFYLGVSHGKISALADQKAMELLKG